MMDGKPVYYRGYKEVLASKKKIEDIVASSTLHLSSLVIYLKLCLEGCLMKNIRY